VTSAPGRSEDNTQKLPRARRITQGSEIRGLFQRGKRSRTAHLDVFDSVSPVSYSRVGVVVPRHKHSAVARNLVKRRLREALRREVLPRMAGSTPRDVIVRARPDAYEATYATLAGELTSWADRTCLQEP
jgi:ribonuclease P protein component